MQLGTARDMSWTKGLVENRIILTRSGQLKQIQKLIIPYCTN